MPRRPDDDDDDYDNDDVDDDMDEEPQLDTSMKHAIIVDGLPIVEQSKREKLLNVVRKFFSQVGTILENGLEMPSDPTGKSLGCAPARPRIKVPGKDSAEMLTARPPPPLSRSFAFIEFSSDAEAAAAIQKADGYKLDKAHTFVVNSYEDHAKYMAVPDQEVEFEPPPYQPKESLLEWLEDAGARDQFVTRYNDETEIWWNDQNVQNPEPHYARRNWSDSYVAWSPRGTYLATFHRLGIMLWGGPSWKKLMKINHGGVKLIDFSPCENFLVTWSPESDQTNALIVWDVKTGAKMRSFQGAKPDGEMDAWPAFLWSHDDAYFARMGDDCIYCYESATMKLIKDKQDKRTSVRVEGVRSFQWSPSDNMISLWIPEHMNSPAKVTLMELPARTEIRQKNLFNVADLRMTWHDQGHFLCVKVDKHSKSKKVRAPRPPRSAVQPHALALPLPSCCAPPLAPAPPPTALVSPCARVPVPDAQLGL